MRMTFVAALLGLSLTACDPVYTIEGTLELPPEALGKPLIIHKVESERLGPRGLPDPYVVHSTTSPQFGEDFTLVRDTSERFYEEEMGCGPEVRLVAWVDMNGSEGFERVEGGLVAPEGWDAREARPDEGDLVGVSLELDFEGGLPCSAGQTTAHLTLRPFSP